MFFAIGREEISTTVFNVFIHLIFTAIEYDYTDFIKVNRVKILVVFGWEIQRKFTCKFASSIVITTCKNNGAFAVRNVARKLRNVKEIGWLTLGRADVVRHALVQKIVEAYEGSPESEDYSGVGARDFSEAPTSAPGAPSVVSSELASPTAFASTVWKSNVDDGRRDDLYYDEDDEASDRN